MQKLCLLAVLAVFWVGCKSEDGATATTTTGGGSTASAAPTFASIQPVINQRCVGCHGDKGKGDLDLRTYESLMKGGEDGPVVKPGDAANSLLVQIIKPGHPKRMPFKQDPLTEEQIKAVEDWINAGAKS